jgi:hypothetical protein
MTDHLVAAANQLSMILSRIGRLYLIVVGDVADARPERRVRQRTLLLGAQFLIEGSSR